MSSYILFLILGLGAGATYAILGQGLVLKYRSAGVVDFAHGAVAMFIAYVFVNLRSFGELELPVVIIPHQISLNGGAGINTTLAIVISLVYSAALGFVLYRLVYRPLRNASQLTRVCASVGVMLALQAIAVLNYSTEPVATNPIFPSGSLKISGVTFPQDRLFFTGVVIVISVALALIYRYTRFGLATRAGAENDRGAALTGISATRIASQNWVIATVLAGAAGILIAPVASLDPTSYTLFIVPALAAALVGRFESFWITALAGLLIGCFQSEIGKLITVWTWLPQSGLSDAVPFIVIIIVMAFRSRSVLARGGEAAQKNPSVGRPGSPLASAGACFVGGLILLLLLNNVLRFAFISSLTVTCIALSVVVLTGYVGQVSLAQMSLAGIGGFMLGHISHGWGLGFPFSLLAAGLCAVPVGLVIGLPALRLRGVNLAVVTLGFAAAMDALIFSSSGFAGSTAGLPIKAPHLLGLNLAANAGRSTNRVGLRSHGARRRDPDRAACGQTQTRSRRADAARDPLERARRRFGRNQRGPGEADGVRAGGVHRRCRRRPDGLPAGRAHGRQLRGVHVDQPARDRVRRRRRADRGSGRRRGHVLGGGPVRDLPRHPSERRQVPGDRCRRRAGADRGSEPGRSDQHVDRKGSGGRADEAPRPGPRVAQERHGRVGSGRSCDRRTVRPLPPPIRRPTSSTFTIRLPDAPAPAARRTPQRRGRDRHHATAPFVVASGRRVRAG